MIIYIRIKLENSKIYVKYLKFNKKRKYFKN